ncbi:MAG TPA: adenylate/guanylate cyclase domain-containing protein [Burkholderiales bacterium]|nr:adenylate/guanylate cyclase domain-containing protein [Burkholderiales bacterium]
MWNRIVSFMLGEGPKGTPPERVRWLIVEQQVRSEILIGWVGFALVLFFLVLYTVSPKTSAGTRFVPVPWVLGAFLAVSGLRLVLAYRRWLNPPLLIVGVCLDIALLLGLIWSFHLQYQQPAPFYLKVPTLLYVFIFIALRALRFEPMYVIAAGLSAAVGWLAMLVYAASSGEMVVTRDYVRYLTSNSVLIGAEIDKVIAILMVTGVLALALARSRRILYRAVLDSVLAKDLSRFVAPEVAERISTSERGLQPGEGEVREATVLFTDIEAFSTFAEKVSPERLVALLNEYFEAISGVVERHGGVITQFQGDAMLITFNTVRDDPDHAAKAVRTAAEIQEMTRERLFGDAVRMRTRCGINTGRIVAGAVGSAERLLYTVHGDEVNIAARLEQLNKKYGTYLLAAESTVRAAGGEFSFRPVDEITVRGRESATRVYTL